MTELLHFMGEHPFLTVVLAYFIAWTVVNSTIAIVAIFRPQVARHLASDCKCDD